MFVLLLELLCERVEEFCFEEGVLHQLCATESVLFLVAHALGDEVLNYVIDIEFFGEGDFLIDGLLFFHEILLRLGGEGELTGDHFEEKDSKGVDIALAGILGLE